MFLYVLDLRYLLSIRIYITTLLFCSKSGVSGGLSNSFEYVCRCDKKVQGFEDSEAQKSGEQLSLPTPDDKKTILDSGVTRDMFPYRLTGGTGFRQFVQLVSCDIIILLYCYRYCIDNTQYNLSTFLNTRQ